MSIEIAPFELGLLDQAGELLARRHAEQRKLRPELPLRFEGAEKAIGAIEAVLKREWSAGVAALNNGKLIGYLIGDMDFDELRGRCGWIRFAGCAHSQDVNPEIIRDLYASLAARWVFDFGCFDHYAVIPNCDSLVKQWFSLGFGLEQEYAVLGLDELGLSTNTPRTGMVIRRADANDRSTVEQMSEIIWQHQVLAPVWIAHLPERHIPLRSHFGDLCLNPGDSRLWLAFLDGKPAGYQCFFQESGGASHPYVPESCIALRIAGTYDWARGKGCGRALFQAGIAEARNDNFRFCLTDWRSTNLSSSRFWPQLGFKTVAYRLSRRVDPRICWARNRL